MPGGTFEPRAQLLLLESILKQELGNQETALGISLLRSRLLISYHGIMALRWGFVDRDLVCTPIGWRRKTYMATGPVQARAITIRLLFEFVKQFRSPPGAG